MIVHRINGRPTDAAGIGRALVNYGHFTTMQVRAGAVRGLGLHFSRLDAATRELFDAALDLDAARAWMSTAASDMPGGDGTLRVLVFPRDFALDDPGRALVPDVLASVLPPAFAGDTPLRVRTHAWLRPLPHIKHVATFPLLDAMRQARRAGYDDVLLMSTEGEVAEGSVWNIAFEDATGVVWPAGPMLDGVTQRLLRAQLAAAGHAQRTARVGRRDLGRFVAAYALNARGIRAIAGIDDHVLDGSMAGLARMRALLEAVPAVALAAAPAIV